MRWATKDPFGLTADPRMYVARPATEEALDELRALLDEGESTVRLAGPAGLGKTLLLRLLPERLGPEWLAAYLGYPKLSPDELWIWVAEELGFGHPSEEGIRAVAARAARRGGGLVLLVDDAQSMPEETRRVLAGICSREPGLRVVLTETCEIDELGHPAEVRLAEPLSVDELKEYLEERVDRAGVGGLEAALFEDVDPGRLFALSQGVPARVHYLAARLQCGDRLPEPGAPSDASPFGLDDDSRVAAVRQPALAPVAPETPAEPPALRIVAPEPDVEVVPEAAPAVEEPAPIVLGRSGADRPAAAPAARANRSAAPEERAEIAAIAASLDVGRLRAAEMRADAVHAEEPEEPRLSPASIVGPPRLPSGTRRSWSGLSAPWGWAPLAAAACGAILLLLGLASLRDGGSQTSAPAVPDVATVAVETPSPSPGTPLADLSAPSAPLPDVSAPGPEPPAPLAAEPVGPTEPVYRTAARPPAVAAPVEAVGYLSVNAVPWARIEIDGKEFGETPLGEVALPVGEHEVKVRFPDGREVARRVTIGSEEIFLVVRQEDS